MKGDFSRETFDPRKHFTRVLMQQGRVQLDADWNEQAAILLHYLQALAADLIGTHGGPAGAWGFEITPGEKRDFAIGPGRYYVDGILCEHEVVLDDDGNRLPLLYAGQPGYPFPEAEELKDGQTYLVYLDVWERHVTCIEEPVIREVALGGPDTATRAKVVWQVKVAPVELGGAEGANEERIEELKRELEDLQAKLEAAKEAAEEAGVDPEDSEAVKELEARIREVLLELKDLQEGGEATGAVPCDDLLHEKLAELGKLAKPALRAQAYVETPPVDACITPPEARYRGAENQLYRVEVHEGGTADEATFKWSRDNGSVVAAWIGQRGGPGAGNDLVVSRIRDRVRGFAAGQWVELTDDELDLRGEPGTMVRVLKAEGDRVTVDPETASDGVNWGEKLKNPKVRRWDHEATRTIKLSSGAVPVEEGKWLDLEDGIRVKFEPGGTYHTGDYWLIPARVATGDVAWPQEREEGGFRRGKLRRDDEGNPIPEALPPHGVEHHYAPLAIISVKDGGDVTVERDCRRRFRPLTDLQ